MLNEGCKVVFELTVSKLPSNIKSYESFDDTNEKTINFHNVEIYGIVNKTFYDILGHDSSATNEVLKYNVMSFELDKKSYLCNIQEYSFKEDEQTIRVTLEFPIKTYKITLEEYEEWNKIEIANLYVENLFTISFGEQYLNEIKINDFIIIKDRVINEIKVLKTKYIYHTFISTSKNLKA